MFITPLSSQFGKKHSHILARRRNVRRSTPACLEQGGVFIFRDKLSDGTKLCHELVTERTKNTLRSVAKLNISDTKQFSPKNWHDHYLGC